MTNITVIFFSSAKYVHDTFVSVFLRSPGLRYDLRQASALNWQYNSLLGGIPLHSSEFMLTEGL